MTINKSLATVRSNFASIDNSRKLPRILIITSCTGEKQFKPSNQLTLADLKDPERFALRSQELAKFSCPAGQLYTGAQHLRLMEGVKILRQSLGTDVIDVKILSTGYGLIAEDLAIVPYEVTFNTMKGHDLEGWAKFLGIHTTFETAIIGYDLVFVMLGENYLRSLALPIVKNQEQTWLFLASQSSQKWIKGLSAKSHILSLGNADAKKYSYGLVGLKGFLFKKFAISASQNPDLLTQLVIDPGIFERMIAPTLKDLSQIKLLLDIPQKAKTAKNKPLKTKESHHEPKQELCFEDGINFLPIPDLPPAPNFDLGMRYFIPEWDDHVDPNYNFLTDTLTPGRDPYRDEVYAHEIYSRPNYDGILVSKVVVESSQKKRKTIEEVGIHQFIRFQGEVMGDCGAFGYIKEDMPPYNTLEILDYYEKLGFNSGVSIDHLIVGQFAVKGIREKRYEITLKNAAEFIDLHRAGRYTHTPIGAAQGWSPETYASAVKDLIGMGYEYIALGGLARAPSREIIDILKAVHPHLKGNIRMHLFGAARLNAIHAFRHLGVTSFDSASALRKAWLDSKENYHAHSNQMYTAVRIPSVDGRNSRVQQIIDAGISDRETLRKLEKNALQALREFDRASFTASQIQPTSAIEDTLSALLAYDDFLELPREGEVDLKAKIERRKKHEPMYRKLLTDRPWQQCDCKICKDVGVETIIFRGNDRNRRRGFHNTYIFYKKFQKALLSYKG